MNVDDVLIDKLCSLSKLSFDGQAREVIKDDLKKILNFVEKINELDTEHVEPLIHMTSEVNHLRADVVEQTITHEEALFNAPKKDSDYIRVPKVLDK